MSLTTYDPGDVRLTVGGNIISGFAEDTMVTVERNSDSYTMSVGCGGEVTRSRGRDTTGRITITLKQTSGSNGVLSLLNILDEQSGGGIVPVNIGAGLAVYSSAQSWIVKPPPAEQGKEASDREWLIDCASLDVYEGGYEAES